MTTALKPGQSGGCFPYFLGLMILIGTHPYLCTATVMLCVAGTVVIVRRRRRERKKLNPTR